MPDHADSRKLVIVGAGCAGLSAAIYAARAGLAPLVIEGVSPGGQLMMTTEVENYPGFPGGVMGPQLIMQMREQAAKFGTELLQEDCVALDLSQKPFRITTDSRQIAADAVIYASGAHANLLGLEAERLLMGHGVSVCATCDAPFFRNKKVLVIGGGDSAAEEASFISRFASEITIVHRRDELRASKILAERTLANPKVKVAWSHMLVDILGTPESGVTGATLQNLKTNELVEVEASGVFIAIGHTPNTDLVRDQLELDKKGYVVTKGSTTLTSVEGVFAAGDVADSRYRQAITAAGMGCRAALDAQHYLEQA